MRFIKIFSVLFLLAACTEGFSEFPVTPEAQAELGENLSIVQLTASNVVRFNAAPVTRSSSSLSGPSGWNYRVGPGDVLSVLVFNHLELALAAGPDNRAAGTEFRVQSDGTFFYPIVGQVQAAGLAPEQIRADLMTRLAEFIADPQLDVRVASFNSQAVNVTGAIARPQRLPVTTVPLTLIDAVNATGGLAPDADAANVSIKRKGATYRVDLEGFLERGESGSNPLLGPGDVVFVPRRAAQEVFVLGEISRPSSIDLAGEPLSLTQAISRQGGVEGLRADARGIFVFRRNGQAMTVYQLSVESPAGYLVGARFMLEVEDVVYVTRSPRQRWNDTIFGLLPSVTAVNTTSSTINDL